MNFIYIIFVGDRFDYIFLLKFFLFHSLNEFKTTHQSIVDFLKVKDGDQSFFFVIRDGDWVLFKGEQMVGSAKKILSLFHKDAEFILQKGQKVLILCWV